jgi:glycerol-3-phosphate O-acyltransferase/dihydroxyacetone phosphate acyltransferase
MSSVIEAGGKKSPQREVRIRIAMCVGLIMLSVDSLNPIKVFCSILDINSWYFACVGIIIFAVILHANAKDLSYFCTKVFFQSIFSIFFSSIEVLGKENIPAHGPIIFTGNHMNQFVDGAVMLVTNPHRVGFLVAEKSMHKRIIGDFSRAIGSIPVSRPQDAATKGPGKIFFDQLKLKGQNTFFTKLSKGDKLRPGRSPETYHVKEVISDTEAILAEEKGDLSPLDEAECQGKWSSYDVLGFVDQGKMFHTVHDALSKGQCLGIFPEGGSHDNTDLLPLKVGVAAIGFGVLDKYDINVPIVPVGLNYFRGHRFRGRVVVEFGEPIHIDKELTQVFRDSKRTAYQTLLSKVEEGMRSVIVTASDYGELKLIHSFRRLYQRASSGITTMQKQDLARRFSVAYRLLKEKYKDGFPEDLIEIQEKLEKYQDSLDKWGLKDYQINDLENQISFSKMLYTFMHGLVVVSLAAIPSIFLNMPVGTIAHFYAHSQAKVDLKASRVKVAARDVLLSKKILFSIVGVPCLWITYFILMLIFLPFEKRTIIVMFLCCPFFSYLGVMAVEAGLVDLKDLRPAFLRLFPSFREHIKNLPLMRLSLQKDCRSIAKKYGPEFGSLYTDPTKSWEKNMKKRIEIDPESENVFHLGKEEDDIENDKDK